MLDSRFTLRFRHAALGAAACLGVGLLTPIAAAQAPPPSPPPGVAPVTPPGVAPPPPPGYQPPMSPAEVPPGYAQPAPGGFFSTPYSMPRQELTYQLPPPPPRRRKDLGMFVGGVLMVGGGLVAVIAGAGLVSSATNRIDIYCDTPSFPCAHKDDATRKGGGIALMAIGAVAGAVGIPMWIIGSQMVIIPRDAPRPALVPELRVGVGSASLAVSF